MLDGFARALVAVRFGLAFNSFRSLNAAVWSLSKKDVIEGCGTSVKSRDEKIEITDDDG